MQGNGGWGCERPVRAGGLRREWLRSPAWPDRAARRFDYAFAVAAEAADAEAVMAAGMPLALVSMRRTALAERPLVPSISSYSTFSPSLRERKPSPSMQLKCT